jgi:hypothetical protein
MTAKSFAQTLKPPPRPQDDAERLGEEAHALTAKAIQGEKATPEQHHEAARAHAAAASAWAAVGNTAKAKEHEGYADHHKGQIVQIPPEEPKPGEKGAPGAKGDKAAKPKAKSFDDVMGERYEPVTKKKSLLFADTMDQYKRNVGRHRSGRFHPLGRITESQASGT